MDSAVVQGVRAILTRALVEPLFAPLEKTLGPVASQAFASVLQHVLSNDRMSDG